MIHGRLISQFLGVLVLILAAATAVPWLLAVWWGEQEAALALRDAVVVATLGGVVLILVGGLKRHEVQLTHREAFLSVTAGWVVAGIFGALPFYFSGEIHGVVDALFESVSGFTTTGATILSDIESVPRSLLLWRATTHWLGGMGIVLLSVAILPLLGVGGMQLYKAEVPGPTADKLRPRIIETARVLWRAYLLLTVAEVVALLLCGMSLFDAVCHSFATVATGGFSTKNQSVESFGSPAAESVIILFMFLAGCNFSLHFLFVKKGVKGYWRDPEFRVYAGIILLASVLVAVGLAVSGQAGPLASVRQAVFQVVSITTTTGFSSVDYEAWTLTHSFPAFVIFLLMFVGGCAGSTGGGPKVVRLWILTKDGVRALFRQIHPRAVRQVRLGHRVVPSDVVSSVTAFFVLYLLIFAAGAAVLALCGLDLESAIAASIACIGNIGPGFGSVGPLDNYAHIPDVGKLMLTALMILGRLELYTVLVLFVPEFWRR